MLDFFYLSTSARGKKKNIYYSSPSKLAKTLKAETLANNARAIFVHRTTLVNIFNKYFSWWKMLLKEKDLDFDHGQNLH